MYEEIADFFDPNSMTEDAAVAFNGENFNPINTHLIHDPNQVLQYEQSNWDTQQANGQQAPDLFNLLHLSPGCHGLTGHLPSSSIAPPALYDPIFHSNLPSQQPPLFGEFFQSSNYEDGNGGHFNNCVLDEFNGDIGMAFTGTKRVKATGKAKKPIISERQRRVEMNDKFAVLRNLVPNPNNKVRIYFISSVKVVNLLIKNMINFLIICTNNKLRVIEHRWWEMLVSTSKSFRDRSMSSNHLWSEKDLQEKLGATMRGTILRVVIMT